MTNRQWESFTEEVAVEVASKLAARGYPRAAELVPRAVAEAFAAIGPRGDIFQAGGMVAAALAAQLQEQEPLQ